MHTFDQTACSEPQRAMEIPSEMQSIHESSIYLLDRLSLLETRLSGVLRSEQTQPAPSHPVETHDNSTELGASIQSVAGTISHASARISSVLDRLEL